MTHLPALDEPRYAQAQLLKLVPGLTSKSLRNWIDRGIIEIDTPAPGRQGKLLWAPSAVVGLRTVSELVKSGFKPSDAVEVAASVVEAIPQFIDRVALDVGEDGRPTYVINASDLPSWRIGVVMRNVTGRTSIYITPASEMLYRVTSASYVSTVIEVDRLIATSLNQVLRFEHDRGANK